MRKLLALALLLCVAALGGCKLFEGSGVELCYTHPKYGVVCVKIKGKEYKIDRPDLTTAEKAEVEKWVKEQPK